MDWLDRLLEALICLGGLVLVAGLAVTVWLAWKRRQFRREYERQLAALRDRESA